jgi:two-component system response regulator HydG
VGANRTYPVDVRFLAATNRNLEAEVAAGRFRQDLYYRLNVVVMTAPPLRERSEDIPLLIRHFTGQPHNGSRPAPSVSKDALACLMTYDWPGNVRELENVIRRAVAMVQGDQILPQDLPDNIYAPPGMAGTATGSNVMAANDTFEAYEYAAIRNALTKCNNNRKRAALMLGIGEATLYRKIKHYNL